MCCVPAVPAVPLSIAHSMDTSAKVVLTPKMGSCKNVWNENERTTMHLGDLQPHNQVQVFPEHFSTTMGIPWSIFFWQGLEETADGFGCFGVYEPTGLFPNANRVDEKDV